MSGIFFLLWDSNYSRDPKSKPSLVIDSISIIIAESNTKISKTHRLMNKMLCLSAFLCVLWLVLPSPFSVAEFFMFLDTVLRKIT